MSPQKSPRWHYPGLLEEGPALPACVTSVRQHQTVSRSNVPETCCESNLFLLFLCKAKSSRAHAQRTPAGCRGGVLCRPIRSMPTRGRCGRRCVPLRARLPGLLQETQIRYVECVCRGSGYWAGIKPQVLPVSRGRLSYLHNSHMLC